MLLVYTRHVFLFNGRVNKEKGTSCGKYPVPLLLIRTRKPSRRQSISKYSDIYKKCYNSGASTGQIRSASFSDPEVVG